MRAATLLILPPVFALGACEEAASPPRDPAVIEQAVDEAQNLSRAAAGDPSESNIAPDAQAPSRRAAAD